MEARARFIIACRHDSKREASKGCELFSCSELEEIFVIVPSAPGEYLKVHKYSR